MTRRARAALGSLVFLGLAPGVVAGLVPWLLTGWEARPAPLAIRVLGGLLIGVGAAALVTAFARFVVEGLGTPAPVAPTERLGGGGPYRYVRNPMYLAVAAVIVGQGLLLGRLVLLAYACGLRSRGLGVRPLVRGGDARPPVRRRLRGLPPRGSGVAAAPASREPEPGGRRVRGRIGGCRGRSVD